jgi:hypothetical protein
MNLFGVVTVLVLAGCTAEEEVTSPDSGGAAPLSLDVNAVSGADQVPSLSAPPPPAPAVSFESESRLTDENGRPLSDLELLNKAIEIYEMRLVTEVPMAQGDRKFNSFEEESAALAAEMEKKVVPLTDLSDLVKAGVVKAIPSAPPGKKYVFDKEKSRVVLTDQ